MDQEAWIMNKDAQYRNFPQSKQFANSTGGRLPTRAELSELINSGYKWDQFNLGGWFGEDAENLWESEQSIFIPAYGYRLTYSDHPNEYNERGVYWSIDSDGAKSFCLSFFEGGATIDFEMDQRHCCRSLARYVTSPVNTLYRILYEEGGVTRPFMNGVGFSREQAEAQIIRLQKIFPAKHNFRYENVLKHPFYYKSFWF